MKEIPSLEGPFRSRLVYTVDEIDQICSDALRQVGLMPQNPQKIRIERFLEKYFNVVPYYEDLEYGILGGTFFADNGCVTRIVISKHLEEDVRLPSTLAHEGGHGLLHAILCIEPQKRSLFGTGQPEPKIMCRNEDIRAARKAYDGKWWEWQANRAISGLLLPKELVAKAMQEFLQNTALTHYLPESNRQRAEKHVAKVFGVSITVARIRLEEMFEPNEPSLL
jgi:Zn-dependent peptidase ImmA (M78 family)